jgi:hypothetical protein
MTAFHLPKQLVMTLLALALCNSVAAQTAPDSQGFVGVKAGMNYEQAEDALAGSAVSDSDVTGRSKWSSGYLRPSAIRRTTRRIAIFS